MMLDLKTSKKHSLYTTIIGIPNQLLYWYLTLSSPNIKDQYRTIPNKCYTPAKLHMAPNIIQKLEQFPQKLVIIALQILLAHI